MSKGNFSGFGDLDTLLTSYASAIKQSISDLATNFSVSQAYSVGDYVTYNKQLWRCVNAHSAGAWSASDFAQVTVESELKLRQPKLLDTPITIGGVSRTTVESALGALNGKVSTTTTDPGEGSALGENNILIVVG